MRRSVRLVWIGGGIAGVAVAAVVVAVPLVNSSHSSPAGAHPATSSARVPSLSAAAAASLSADLASGTDSGLRQAIVVPQGQVLDPAAVQQLRAISPVSLDVSTFQALDATDATVRGTVSHPPAGQPAAWTFTLALVDGNWKFVDAEPER
jgi:hypothetical protein